MAVAAVKGVVFVGGIFRGQLDSRDEKPEGTFQFTDAAIELVTGDSYTGDGAAM